MIQPHSGPSDGGELAELLQPFPRLSVTRGDMATYNIFRRREPALVSIADHEDGENRKALDALVLFFEDDPLGAASYIVQTNQHRGPVRNQFARIDLVMADNRFRNLGVGRALVMCVMFHLLRNWQDKLYSISCLAAHEAIRKTLEGIGFVGQAKENLNYVHEEMKLDDSIVTGLTAEMEGRASAALKIVNYHLRQQGGTS